MASETIDQARRRYSEELAKHTFSQWTNARKGMEVQSNETSKNRGTEDTSARPTSQQNSPLIMAEKGPPARGALKIVDFGDRPSARNLDD